jgi:hypothetical protein
LTTPCTSSSCTVAPKRRRCQAGRRNRRNRRRTALKRWAWTDCTGPELYAALIKRVGEHDDHLARAIGGTDPSDLREMIPLIVKAAEAAPLPKDGWFLKEDKAKEMLRRTRPWPSWSASATTWCRACSKPKTFTNYSWRCVSSSRRLAQRFRPPIPRPQARRFRTPPHQSRAVRRGEVGRRGRALHAKKRHNITHSKEMGAIAVMPMKETHMKGITLKAMPLLFHYFNEIRLYSSFFKLMKTKQNFGAIVADTLIADPAHVKITDSTHIHWRVIQRYFGKLTTEVHPEIFEPHVQPEDLHWRRAEEVLYDIDPELEFWKGLDFVAVLKGKPKTPLLST